MGSGLSKFARTTKLVALAIAISVCGFSSTNAQQYFNERQAQPQSSCPSCRYNPCRCRPRLQFVNPNQFLCEPQSQDQCPPNADGTVYPPSGVDPSNPQPMADQPDAQPLNLPDQGAIDSNALAFGQGGGSEGTGFGDALIGDFFGGGSYLIWSDEDGGEETFILPVAGGDRRYKVTENTSPIPTDRFIFNYNFFANPLTDANGNVLDLHRYVFGLERTFLQGNASLEFRIPFVNGVNSEQIADFGGPPNRHNEFGNVSMTTKFLLTNSDGWSSTSGLGIILPTADAVVLTSPFEALNVEIANEAYFLQPFFAVQRRPNQFCWINFLTQVDFAAQGNTVTVTDTSSSEPVILSSEIYNDQHLLFLDLSMGRWLYQANRRATRHLDGIAGIFELHYTTALNDTDVVAAGDSTEDTLSNPANRQDVLNATMGLRFLLNGHSTLTVSGVAPLSEGDDRLFDGELSVQLSRYR